MNWGPSMIFSHCGVNWTHLFVFEIITQCCVVISLDSPSLLLQLLSVSLWSFWGICMIKQPIQSVKSHSRENLWAVSSEWGFINEDHYDSWHDPNKTWSAESAAQQILHCPTYECLTHMRGPARAVNPLQHLYIVFFSAFLPPHSPHTLTSHTGIILHSSHSLWLYFHECHIFCVTGVCSQWI